MRVSTIHPNIPNRVMAIAAARPAILAAIVGAFLPAAAAGGAATTPSTTPPAAAQGGEYQVPLPYLTPIPVVRMAGELTRAGVRVSLLRVKTPRNSKVTLRCRGGRSRGCPFKSKTKTAPRGGLVRFREVQHALRAGVRLKVFARRGNTIGKYTRFIVRKHKAPKRSDACVFPGDPFEPRTCP
jgi:hypothetical protein